MRSSRENTREFSRGPEFKDPRKRSRMLDAEVGQSIRYHRKRAKMTLMGLADRLGIAYQQVQKYETGVNRVGAGRIMEIAEVLQIPVAFLFEANNGEAADGVVLSASPQCADVETAAQQRQLLTWFLRISNPEKRKMAVSYVGSLVERRDDRTSEGIESA